MAEITVQSITINTPWKSAITAPTLRLYLNMPVVTSDSLVMESGSPNGNGTFYAEYTCSVSGTALTIPQIIINSLSDALVGSGALYSAYFYAAAGSSQQLSAYNGFTAFSVPAAPTSTTWAALLIYNSTVVPYNDYFTYSRTVIDSKIAAVASGGSISSANYIVETPQALLPNSFALSTIASGSLLKVGGSGVPAAAVSGTDYSAAFTASAPLSLSAGVLSVSGVALLGAGNTWTTGAQSFAAATSLLVPIGAGAQPSASGSVAYDSTANRFGGGANGTYGVFVTPASTDVLTNKTFDTGGSGNVFKVAGTAISATTGSGAVALATSPSFTTPSLGAATATSVIGLTGTLMPNAAGGIAVGTAALPFSGIYIGGAATNNTLITGTTTAARTFTLPDANSNPVQPATAASHKWANAISSAGVITFTQPAFTDISGTLGNAAGGTGLDSSSAANGALLIGNGSGLSLATLTAGSNISITNSSGGISISASVTAGSAWSSLANPTGNLVIAMGTDTTAFTWGNITGGPSWTETYGALSGSPSVNQLQIQDTTSNTNTGALAAIQTASGSTASPLLVTAQGTANGISVNTSGVLVAAGTGGVSAAAITTGTLSNSRLAASVVLTNTSPQLTGLGVGQAAPAITAVGVTGATILAQASASVASLQAGGVYTSNDSSTKSFYDTLLLPTFNPGSSNSNKTISVLRIDTTNTALTGLTVNLLDVNYGGSNKLLLSSAGVLTLTGSMTASSTINNITFTQPASTATLTLGTGTTLTGPSTTDTIAGIAATQALTNKTITSSTNVLGGVTMTLGSDATGDIYYRSGGVLTRLGIGSSTQVLTVTGGVPVWAAATGGSGTPGGSTTQLQYNNASAFGGVSGWTTNGTTLLTALQTALGATQVDALLIEDTTASTTSTLTQNSPALHFSSTVYDYSLASPGSVVSDVALFQSGKAVDTQRYTVSSATNTAPIQIVTSTGTNWDTGDQVVITGATGNTGANGTFFVQKVNSTTWNLIGSTGNGTYNANTAHAARQAVGFLALSSQYNAGGYNVLGGFSTAGSLFVGSSSPLEFNTALQVTGGIYQTDNGAGAVPYQMLGQATSNYFYSEHFINASSTAAGASGGTGGTYTFAVNTTLSAGSSQFGVGGYFATAASSSSQSIWGLNPLVQAPPGISTITMRAIEADVNNNSSTANPPDVGNTGFADGVDAVCGGNFNCTAAFASYHGSTQQWKHFADAAAVGYGGYTGQDPSIIFASHSNNNVVYGLNMRTATFQTSLTSGSLKGVIAGPYAIPSVISVNQAGTADIPIIQLSTAMNAVSNVVSIGQAATTTTTTSPIAGMWVGNTSLSTAFGAGTFGFQSSDSASTVVISSSVAAGATFRTFRADGTSASLAAITSGDVLGSWQNAGYDGSVLYTSALIQAVATENWVASTNAGTQLKFFITPTGTHASLQSMTISGTGAVSFLGSNTNDSASAGQVGEFVQGIVATGGALSITSATPTNVTSISLTAGDWDVQANVNINYTSATTLATSNEEFGISTTTATFPSDGSEVYNTIPVLTAATTKSGAALPRKRISIASTTTVFLVAQTTFSAGTATGFGQISARRVR